MRGPAIPPHETANGDKEDEHEAKPNKSKKKRKSVAKPKAPEFEDNGEETERRAGPTKSKKRRKSVAKPKASEYDIFDKPIENEEDVREGEEESSETEEDLAAKAMAKEAEMQTKLAEFM